MVQTPINNNLFHSSLLDALVMTGKKTHPHLKNGIEGRESINQYKRRPTKEMPNDSRAEPSHRGC